MERAGTASNSDFGHRHDLSRAVDPPGDLHDGVDRGGQLGTDRGQRECDTAEQHERLEPGERVGG